MSTAYFCHNFSLDYFAQFFKLKHLLYHLNLALPQLKPALVNPWDDVMCVLLVENGGVLVVVNYGIGCRREGGG